MRETCLSGSEGGGAKEFPLVPPPSNVSVMVRFSSENGIAAPCRPSDEDALSQELFHTLGFHAQPHPPQARTGHGLGSPA